MNGPRASGDVGNKSTGDPWLKATGCPAPPFLVEDLRVVPGFEVGHVPYASLSLSEAVSRARAGLTADRSDVDSDG